jgi:DNA replication protein DnaC
MDEGLKVKAAAYMAGISGKVAVTPRFPVSFGTQENALVSILGTYGAVVKGRGVDFRMDDATVSKVEKVVKWIFESNKRGLLLCGTLGNGKTTMLTTFKMLFGPRAVYYEAQALYDYYKLNQTLPRIMMNDVLLIDDLGVEPNSYNEFGDRRYPLADIILARYRQNATTIIATNCTLEQIGEQYGDRVRDRMKEMFAMIKYIEPSYR